MSGGREWDNRTQITTAQLRTGNCSLLGTDLKKIDKKNNDACVLCGRAQGSAQHFVKECTYFAPLVKYSAPFRMEDLNKPVGCDSVQDCLAFRQANIGEAVEPQQIMRHFKTKTQWIQDHNRS